MAAVLPLSCPLSVAKSLADDFSLLPVHEQALINELCDAGCPDWMVVYEIRAWRKKILVLRKLREAGMPQFTDLEIQDALKLSAGNISVAAIVQKAKQAHDANKSSMSANQKSKL